MTIIIKFNYIVIIVNIETYLEEGLKFTIKTDNTIPFISKELAEQYLEEIKNMGGNALLIDLKELAKRV